MKKSLQSHKMHIIFLVILFVGLYVFEFYRYGQENFSGGSRQTTSTFDQSVNGATQYYDQSLNEQAGKRPLDPLPPNIPSPAETCPMASWYGDKIFSQKSGGNVVRSPPVDSRGVVEWEKSGIVSRQTMPSSAEYQESNDAIYRRTTTQIEKCNKPCFGVWDVVLGNQPQISSFAVNEKSDVYATLDATGMEVSYIDINGTPISTGINTSLITVSPKALYYLSSDGALMRCSEAGVPCKKGTAGQRMKVSGLVGKIKQMEITQDDQQLWAVVGLNELYLGKVNENEVVFEKIGGISLAAISGISVGEKYVLVENGGNEYQLIERYTQHTYNKQTVENQSKFQITSDKYIV